MLQARDVASPQGAHLATFDLADLIRVAKQQFPEELEKILSGELDPDDANFAELVRLDMKIQALIEIAYTSAKGDDGHHVWQDVFDRVFEGKLCKRAGELFSALSRSFDWYDPDTTYQEDVTYFARALHDRVEELKPQFPAVLGD